MSTSKSIPSMIWFRKEASRLFEGVSWLMFRNKLIKSLVKTFWVRRGRWRKTADPRNPSKLRSSNFKRRKTWIWWLRVILWIWADRKILNRIQRYMGHSLSLLWRIQLKESGSMTTDRPSNNSKNAWTLSVLKDRKSMSMHSHRLMRKNIRDRWRLTMLVSKRIRNSNKIRCCQWPLKTNYFWSKKHYKEGLHKSLKSPLPRRVRKMLIGASLRAHQIWQNDMLIQDPVSRELRYSLHLRWKI